MSTKKLKRGLSVGGARETGIDISTPQTKQKGFDIDQIFSVDLVNKLFVTLRNDNRPHARVEIFGEKLIGLMDSGANVTILGKGNDESIKNWPIEWRELIFCE